VMTRSGSSWSSRRVAGALARHGRAGRRRVALGGIDSVDWIRRLRAAGAGWHVLPEPSVPELYPHARNADDAPWHSAKREIAEALHELTLLPAMN